MDIVRPFIENYQIIIIILSFGLYPHTSQDKDIIPCNQQLLINMTEDIDAIDKLDIEALAGDTLELEDDLVGIKIAVSGFTEKGSGLTKYTVYFIKAEDKEGSVEVYRRFSEFYALREVLLQRWPGCFIPAVPDKKVIGKNDDMIKKNRQRFLDNFVKKIASLPYLYYSQQFQTLLRSKENNVTETFEKYQKPSYEEIINRYKDSFSELAGKQVNNQTSVKISSFYTFLLTSQHVLSGYKDMAKRLAISRTALDRKLSSMFTKIIPDYQKICLTEYVSYDESKMVYLNPNNAKLQEQGQIIANLCSKNPYWLVYDLVKLEDRDGQAFLAAIQSKSRLQNKKNDIESKIRDNQKQIQQVSMGNTTVKSFFSKGSKEEVKMKLQRQNQQLQRDKSNVESLIDIICALLAYITIDQYRQAKKKYYSKIFKAVSSYEINFVQNMYDIWNSCLTQTCKFTGGKNDLQETIYPKLSTVTPVYKKEEEHEIQYPEIEVEETHERKEDQQEKQRFDSEEYKKETQDYDDN